MEFENQDVNINTRCKSVQYEQMSLDQHDKILIWNLNITLVLFRVSSKCKIWHRHIYIINLGIYIYVKMSSIGHIIVSQQALIWNAI